MRAEDVEANLLPLVHDVVRILERDNQDVSQRAKDSHEAAQKVTEIGKKIETLRERIHKLAGVETTPQEQLKSLDTLKKQLRLKKKLIAKYRSLNLKVSGLSPAPGGAY